MVVDSLRTARSSVELVVYSLATPVRTDPVGCPDRPSSVGLTRTIEPYWREMGGADYEHAWTEVRVAVCGSGVDHAGP